MLMQQHPGVRKLFESDEAVTLTAEEHEALNQYFCLESNAEMIERAYHFYMGQSMMFSYGSMLAGIRNSVMGEESVADHLLDLVAETRTDEIEDEFQEKSQKYRDAIQEVTLCENAIQALRRNRQTSRRIKSIAGFSYVSEASDVHSFGILHSRGAQEGKSCSAQASSVRLIAGAFWRTQSK